MKKFVELESPIEHRTREEDYDVIRGALVTRLVDYHISQGRALSEDEVQQIRGHLKALGREQIMKAIAACGDEAFLQALQLA